MRKAIFAPKIYDIIEDFTDYRMSYFDRVYSDTGIFGENSILERYRDESKGLVHIFLGAITHDIELGVLGVIYKTEGDREYSRLVTRTGSHILIIWIRRVIGEDDIFVEDLEIQT